MRIGISIFIGGEDVGRMALVGDGVLRKGILAGTGRIILVIRIRVLTILEVDAPVLVAVLIQTVGIIRGEGELLDGRYRELNGIGKVAAVLLVAGLPFREQHVTSVGHIVVTGNQGCSIQPASVRVLRDKGSQGMTGCISKGVLDAAAAGIVVVGAKEGGVVGDAGVFVDTGIDLGPQVVAVEYIRILFDDTALHVVCT